MAANPNPSRNASINTVRRFDSGGMAALRDCWRSADRHVAAHELASDDPQSLQLARIEGAARDPQSLQTFPDVGIERRPQANRD